MEKQENQQDRFICDKVNCCPFFISMKGSCDNLIKKLKQQYCFNDNTSCARYHLSRVMGMESVPPSMLPHQWEWTNQILKDGGRFSDMRNPEDMKPREIHNQSTKV